MKNLLDIKENILLESKNISFNNIYTSFHCDKVYLKKYSKDVLLSKLMDIFNSCKNDMNEDNLEKLYKNLELYIEGLDGINKVYRNALDLSLSFSVEAMKISLTLMLIRDLIDNFKKMES